MPEAKTLIDRIEMNGKKVTVSEIEDAIGKRTKNEVFYGPR